MTLPNISTVLARQHLLVRIAFVLALSAIAIGVVQAGTTGTEWQATYDLIMGWAKGYLGKIFAVMAFLVGCGFAAARQNAMPAIFGLVLALIIGFAPAQIEAILTATI